MQVFTSKGACPSFHFHAGLSIADFYKSLFSLLKSLNIYVAIVQKRYNLTDVHHKAKDE